MAYPKVCNVIAYVYAVLSGLGILWKSYELIIADGFHGNVTGVTRAFDIFHLALTTVVFIASVFLIMGIKNLCMKRHQLVAPWVYVVAITGVLNLLSLVYPQEDWIVTIIGTVIAATLWFLVFSYYRELRNSKPPQRPESDPLNTGYNAYPPTVQPTSYAFPPPGAYPPQPQAAYNTQAQPLYPNVPSAHSNPAPNANYPRSVAYPTVPIDSN